nr:hypothetical protein [Tanacetum cinerariifolium]
MGDENHIRTLRDYSKPGHEGYKNTIKHPVGNNVVPLRSNTIRTVKHRNDILMFHQHHRESLSEAWTRFKDLLQKFPHHGNDLWLQVYFFYDHVNPLKDKPLTNRPVNCMEDPEQAFVEYAFSRFDEVGNTRLSKFEADFKQQQSEMTNKIDIMLKAITDRIAGALPSDTVKNPKLSTSLILSARSYPDMDPQCSTHIHGSINAVTIHSEKQSDSYNEKAKENEEEEKDNLKNIHVNPSTPPDPSVAFITEKVLKFNSFFESLELVPQSSDPEVVCTKGDDGEVMFIEIIRKNDDSREEKHEEEGSTTTKGVEVKYFDMFPTRSGLAYPKYLISIIDPRLSQVVLGRHFVEISNMTHDPPEGVVRFINAADEVSYKMPHKIEQYNSLLDLEKEHTKSVYLRNEEDKRRGVEYIMSKILGFYKECLEIGPKYVIGMDDEGKFMAVVRLPDPKLKTLGERGIECIFVGYVEYSKAFRFFVIEPNDSVLINSIIESMDAIFNENRFSSVPRPSQRSLVNETEDNGGSVVTEEVVQQSKLKLIKSKRNRTPKDFRPEFQLYLIEWTRDEVSNQHFYCFNVEDDPKTFDEAMKSKDVVFWKDAINDQIESIMGNNTWVLADLPPVARISTIRLLIAMTSIHNMFIHQMDVKTTLLNDKLEEEVDPTKEFLSLKFPMKDIGEADVILVSTPMDTSEKLMPNNGQAVSQLEYSRVIGCFLTLLLL